VPLLRAPADTPLTEVAPPLAQIKLDHSMMAQTFYQDTHDPAFSRTSAE
jgi:hypothetical protein